MYKELIINSAEHETRVALLEDRSIVELLIDRGDDSNIAGNIYKGRVQRVLPGMQAAFVDIGLHQAAFIYVDDVLGDVHAEHDEYFIKRSNNSHTDSEQDEFTAPAALDKPAVPIEELLSEGQEILVQVAKSPIGSKGARITSHISLPGRFLVLMPTVNHIGISRRIEDEEERTRLKEMISNLREKEYGFIVRTAGEGVGLDKLEKEMHFLINLWSKIQKKYQAGSAPMLLHKELSITLRAVRDLLTDEADKLIVDSPDTYRSLLSFLEEFMPGLKDSVELYCGNEPIFDAFNLEVDILRALKKKVWLKSGGYIVIELTEALVAIDVNTGRYVGKHNFEETILKTNLEAVKEIAYQIRLRNLGGIIIIDFIDMEKPSDREKVFNALKEALKKDKSKTNVLPMSDMGLIQMTRKRVRKSLTRLLCEPCFYCDGDGYLISKQSICYNIFREILREAQDMLGSRFTLRVNPEIAELLHGEENNLITSLERKLNKQIIIYPNSRFHVEEFDIFEIIK
ncbi:MAG: Rne/Rng family ribonuclease [Deltaproteobacteria bacterium]|nr:MAG: Rne/Rng family ribonuclease [Deltaproteobacteria bacterium]